MIIIKLKGGLGNQLLQYATGRALSLRLQKKRGEAVPIKFDVTGYAENNGIDTLRTYSLSHFNIQAGIATPEEIRQLKYPYGTISKGWRFFRAKVLRQFNTYFKASILHKNSPLYLDGFFNSEKYFIDAREKILQDIVLTKPMSPAAQGALKDITSKQKSVSFHVRRGDYVKDNATNKVHGTCDAAYYAKALDYIAAKIGPDIHLFIFSDDIDWVRNNMPQAYPTTFVSRPEIPDYEELLLMSKCAHHIIANSSFSWWAAWLDNNPDKIVIAPLQWSRKGKRHFKDIVPSTWIRL